MGLFIRRAARFVLASLLPAIMLLGFSAPITAAPAKTAPAKVNCALPKLDFRSSHLKAKSQAEFSARFKAAFDRACAEGLMADSPLIDPEAFVKDTIFVLNASEANVTSIYFGPSAAPPAMLLESPFVTPDGALHLPSVEDIHEAIYCAQVGSTEKEQEESGRCLPD